MPKLIDGFPPVPMVRHSEHLMKSVRALPAVHFSVIIVSYLHFSVKVWAEFGSEKNGMRSRD